MNASTDGAYSDLIGNRVVKGIVSSFFSMNFTLFKFMVTILNIDIGLELLDEEGE